MGISSERVGGVKKAKGVSKGVSKEVSKEVSKGVSLVGSPIRDYIELFERYGLDELCIEENGFEFVLKRDGIVGGLGVMEEGVGAVGGGVGEGLAYGVAGAYNTVEDRGAAEWVLKGEGEGEGEWERRGESVGEGERGVEGGQEYTIVSSPIVGTFYNKPNPESPPFVIEGSVVNEESTIGIVEAMKMMNEIKAECRGKIVKILAEDGSLLKKGQAIFYINPNI